MSPNNSMKENEDHPFVNDISNGRNSLVAMLADGRRLKLRRGDNKQNKRQSRVYPPMNPHMQFRTIQGRERTRQNSLDTTFHATSHLLIDDTLDCDFHHPENKLFTLKGTLTSQVVKSSEYELYTSVDLSNVTNTGGNIGLVSNASLFCVNISKHSSLLQSLCLYNCQIDDTCVNALLSIMTSKSNLLKSLNLSRNIVTDIGAKTLLVAMESHHCMIQELDLSQNQLTVTGILPFAQSLSALPHLKILRLADSEQLIPLSIYQQFAAAIEKNVVLHTLTLGSEVMDGTINERDGEHAVQKKPKFDDFLLSFWHEPMFTTVTDHIRMMLQQNHSGIGALMDTNRTDVSAIWNVLNAVKPEKQIDTCFRLLRLKPDMLLTLV